jgi:hypothetical protein
MADILACPHCGSEQILGTSNLQGIYVSAVTCTNGGCAASGPFRESEEKDLAEELALEAYMRAWSTFNELRTVVEFVSHQNDEFYIPENIRLDDAVEKCCSVLERLKLDLDRRTGVGHNYRAPGGAKKRE